MWRKNNAPYFVRPDGRVVVMKLDGRVPNVDDECEVIASESAMPVALAASDYKIGGAEESSSSSGGQPPPDAALFPIRPDDDDSPEPERDEALEDAEAAKEKESGSRRCAEM